MRDWWLYSIGGNELWRILMFFAVVLAALIAGKVARVFMDRTARHAEARLDTWRPVVLHALTRPLMLAAVAIGVRLGLASLVLSETMAEMADTVCAVLGAGAIGYTVYCLVDIVDHALERMSRHTGGKLDDALAPMVGKSIRITVAVVAIINIVHQVSGKSITTILAGLGVGGLAVALAAQDTIKNFFGSLVILGDHPFSVGDRIVIEGHDGTVERIGFRSTRLRTLDGHLVTIPNGEVTTRMVKNISLRPSIKRVATLSITYDTPPEKVERALAILRELLAEHEGMHPDFPPRVFFSEFANSALELLVIYWYHPPVYWDYMQFSDRFNLEVLRRFNAEGIEFAFPTQSIYLRGAAAAADERSVAKEGAEPDAHTLR